MADNQLEATDDQPVILNSRELAARYRVNRSQPSRWAAAGLLGPVGGAWFRTLGGQLRFYLAEVERMAPPEDLTP